MKPCKQQQRRRRRRRRRTTTIINKKKKMSSGQYCVSPKSHQQTQQRRRGKQHSPERKLDAVIQSGAHRWKLKKQSRWCPKSSVSSNVHMNNTKQRLQGDRNPPTPLRPLRESIVPTTQIRTTQTACLCTFQCPHSPV